MKVTLKKEGILYSKEDVKLVMIELDNGSRFRIQQFGKNLKIIATDEMDSDITIRPVQANVVMVGVSK